MDDSLVFKLIFILFIACSIICGAVYIIFNAWRDHKQEQLARMRQTPQGRALSWQQQPVQHWQQHWQRPVHGTWRQEFWQQRWR